MNSNNRPNVIIDGAIKTDTVINLLENKLWNKGKITGINRAYRRILVRDDQGNTEVYAYDYTNQDNLSLDTRYRVLGSTTDQVKDFINTNIQAECPNCSDELCFESTSDMYIQDTYICPNCGAEVTINHYTHLQQEQATHSHSATTNGFELMLPISNLNALRDTIKAARESLQWLNVSAHKINGFIDAQDYIGMAIEEIKEYGQVTARLSAIQSMEQAYKKLNRVKEYATQDIKHSSDTVNSLIVAQCNAIMTLLDNTISKALIKF